MKMLRHLLYLAVVVSAAACHGSKPPATVGSSGGTDQPGGAPTSTALVAMVRGSNMQSAQCSADATTVGAVYAEQARMLQAEATDMHVDFVESGECKPATTAGSAWSCTVSASPDWAAVKPDPQGEEGGTSFQVMFDLDEHDAIVPSTVSCVAPG